MFSFLKKLFGTNKKVEPMKQEPLKEQPVVTPRPEGLDKSTHAAATSEAKADLSKEDHVVSTKEKDVSVNDFEDPVEEDENVYDVKKHPKGWQVILPDAQRATRVLSTQQEAIDYCKTNDYKFNVYKEDGTLRK